MKNSRTLKQTPIILALFTLVLLNACVDEPTSEENVAEGYVVGLRASDGDASADYLVTHKDLMSDTISATGKGFEQSGWSYYFSAGNKYFSIGYTLNEVNAYAVEDGLLVWDDKFIFDRIDLLAPIDDESFLGIGAPWGGGSYDCQIQVIDVEGVLIDKNVSHPIYESFDDQGVQLNAWPTGAYVEDDKLFISSYPLYGDSWATPNTDSAIMSIFSYPGIEFETTITDDRTGPIGYYSSHPVILENEQGDHYTISPCSKMAGYTQSTKPSGVLKINKGEQKFDEDYFFNVEEKGYKIMSGVYVGNDLAVVKVISNVTDDTLSASWGAFGNYVIMEAAVIDLEAQTLDVIEDIPVHRGQYLTPYYLEDGKVYMVAGTETDWYIYRIDPLTGKAEKGAMIEGIDLQCIFKI